VQLGFQLLLACILAQQKIVLHFLLLLQHEFLKHLGHASVHPVNSLSSPLLLGDLLFIFPLLLSINSPLQHSLSHLLHLLRFLVADS
jgi:hypothetical protein